MQIRGISHITFIVRDIDRMATFLCEGLGACEVYDSAIKNFSLSHLRTMLREWTSVSAIMKPEISHRR